MTDSCKLKNTVGFIVFKDNNGTCQVLITKEQKGYYEFPKDTRRKKESTKNGALRILREKTGLQRNDIKLVGNQYVTESKTIYFIAKLKSDRKQKEFEHYDWVNLDEATKIFEAEKRAKRTTCKLFEAHVRYSLWLSG